MGNGELIAAAEEAGFDLLLTTDKNMRLQFQSLTEAIDTTNPIGCATWQMIGVLAELERSLISERTRAGVIAAKTRGVKFGRRPEMTPQQIAHARKLIEADALRDGLGGLVKVNRKTLYRTLGG